MGNYGASYFNKSDDDAANDWFRIAALSKQIGDEAEKTDTAAAYESLVGGKGIPEGMSDTVRINAKKMLKENLEGETVAAEQNIMADLAAKSKEQGVGINDYLRNNVESYLTTPASYRAVGNISKMFQERQLADANYQKAKIEEGVLRYKEVSSLIEAADGLYQKGDMDGARKMVERFSKILPVPGYLKTNDETGDLEGYATDLKDGGHKPSGQKYDVRRMIDAAKSVSRDEFALGYALNSHVIRETNAKNLQDAVIMKDDKGGRYMGFNFVDPYDATDTKFVVKQYGTGKDVGRFASVHDAVDSGFTPYNQKYEKGELDIENEKRQGRNLDLSARNLSLTGQGLGLDNMYKKLRNEEQGVQTDVAMATRDDKIKYEKFKSLKEVSEASKAMYDVDKAADEKEQRELEARANLLEAALVGGGVFNGKKPKTAGDGSEGMISYGVEEMKNAKSGVDRLVDMGIDRQLIPGMTQKALKDSAEYASDTDKYKNAFISSLSISTGMPVEAIEAYSSPSFRNLPIDEQEQVIQKRIEANALKKKEEEAKAKTDEGDKKAEAVFRSIADNYDRLKKQRTGHLNGQTIDNFTGKTLSDDDLWAAAAQPPLFGQGLYDIREGYFRDKSPKAMLEMAKQWYAKKQTAEADKKNKQELSKTDLDIEKQNRKSFYEYGSGYSR